MRRAFTLVELLVVIAIITALSSMVLGMTTLIGDSSNAVRTESLMSALGGGMERFKSETGFYPLPSGSPEEPYPADYSIDSWYPTEPDGAWEDQRLGWRLTMRMPDDGEALGNLRDAIDTAESDVHPLKDDPQARRGIGQWFFYCRNPGDVGSLISSKVASGESTVSGSRDLWYGFSDDYMREHLVYEDHKDFDDLWLKSGQPYSTANDSLTLGLRLHIQWLVVDAAGKRRRQMASRAHQRLPVLGRSDLPEGSLREDGAVQDGWGQPLAYIHRWAPGTMILEEVDIYGKGKGLLRQPITFPALQRMTLEDRNADGVVAADDLLEPLAGTPADAARQFETFHATSWQHNALPDYEAGWLLISAGSDGLQHRDAGDASNDDNLLSRGGL